MLTIGWLCSNGATIIFALSETPWPGQASVLVCVPIFRKGEWGGKCTLDGLPASSISSTLEPFLDLEPYVLASNKPLSTTGFLTYGRGFVLTAQEASALGKADPKSTGVIFPLLSVDDLLYDAQQSPSQFLINFGDSTENQAREYKACFTWVEDNVKPDRMTCSRTDAKKFWWRLVGRATTFFAVVESLGLKRVIVNAHLSKHLVFVLCSPKMSFEKNVNMFALDGFHNFAVLQSSVHLAWADLRSSSLESRRRYTTTTCFDTYPLPNAQPYNSAAHVLQSHGSSTRLTDTGEAYYQFRQVIMDHTQKGLTDTYNCFHDPNTSSSDIRTLRELHVEMDRVVAAAYGWSDLELRHDFHETKQGVRYTISEPARREVLQRLLKLNHERYAEEVKQGLHDKKKPKPSKKKANTASGPTLFQEEDGV